MAVQIGSKYEAVKRDLVARIRQGKVIVQTDETLSAELTGDKCLFCKTHIDGKKISITDRDGKSESYYHIHPGCFEEHIMPLYLVVESYNLN